MRFTQRVDIYFQALPVHHDISNGKYEPCYYRLEEVCNPNSNIVIFPDKDILLAMLL